LSDAIKVGTATDNSEDSSSDMMTSILQDMEESGYISAE
jgi:hypothetical protein